MLIVIVTAVIYLLPTIKPTFWPHKKINLGLDLQGGMHLVLEVDTQKAVESNIERISQEIRSLCKKEHIRRIQIERIQGAKILVTIKDEDSVKKFEAFLDKEFRGLRIASKSTKDGVLSITLDLPEK